MSQAVHDQSGRARSQRSQEIVGALETAAATGEVAARGLVGGIQALCVVVRDYPVLSVFLAAGVGYLLGKARGSVSSRRG